MPALVNKSYKTGVAELDRAGISYVVLGADGRSYDTAAYPPGWDITIVKQSIAWNDSVPPGEAVHLTLSANEAAAGCKEFAAANNSLAEQLSGGKKNLSLTEWKAAQLSAVNGMDKAGLASTGEVHERIEVLVSGIPSDPLELALTSGRAQAQAYNVSLDRISNA
ncbi:MULTISPECIES: PASTA domain-containing protein [unclassified Arthrobacter]|uniref:PASTA domain-containing protein n=1 Tax=unclassified Arthrobacter TaxID=235627 RepID=UPI00288322FC|nr:MULTISPECIES: PASTA domain-containing protein [unclassified Arthrobacter]